MAGSLGKFLGNRTFRVWALDYCWIWSLKVTGFSKRMTALPVSPHPPHLPHHLAHQANSYPNQDLLSLGVREPPPCLTKLLGDADCRLIQPRFPTGNKDSLAQCVLTLHLPLARQPQSPASLPRIQTAPQPLLRRVLIFTLSIT